MPSPTTRAVPLQKAYQVLNAAREQDFLSTVSRRSFGSPLARQSRYDERDQFSDESRETGFR